MSAFRTLFALVVVLAVFVVFGQSRIRETETPGYFIHIPISADKLKAYLVEPLVPDLFDGVAYVQVAFFHISKLESEFLGKFFTNPIDGDCARTSALVYDPIGKRHGYMILSADFPKDALRGIVATWGCSATNWMICGSSALTVSDAKLASKIKDYDDWYYEGEPVISAKTVANQTFWRWAQVDRPFRWEQSRGKTYYQERPSTNKDKENANSKVYPMTLKSWKSTLFSRRFAPELQEADSVGVTNGLCANQRCFKADTFTFVDGDSKVFPSVPRP